MEIDDFSIKLSDKDIQKFKKIYKEDYKIELSDDEANRLAKQFLLFMWIVTRPFPKEK